MMKYVFFLLLFTCSTILKAQLLPAAMKPIPADLKKNAHSVKRDEHIEMEIYSAAKYQYKVQQVITILDEAGSEELEFVHYTDKFISLEDVKIELYEDSGKLLKKYGKKDMLTQMAGEGLVPDGKVYYLKVISPTYPVTLQVNYTLKYNGHCGYPAFTIQIPDQSTESAVFTVKVPSDLDIRYKLNRTATIPIVVGEGRYKHYNWSFQNLPALLKEEGSVNKLNRYPKIILAPNKFELDGYPGDMTSWKNFGKWYGNLSKDAGKLSELRKLQLNDLVKKAVTEKEKISIIYQYLQQNFRYVSIQLGIGRYKPFEADFVDKNKYGDCKGLCNYTQACLAAIGIKSYQALINAEYNQQAVDPDFPNNSFNHVILCVPLSNDTVWLECTSATNDFGVLGNFTENRNALLITEAGGILVATPQSKASNNRFSSTSKISVNEDGTGNAVVNIISSGEYKQEMLHFLTNKKKDEQKEFLIDYLSFIHPYQFELVQNNNNVDLETKISMSFDRVPSFTTGDKLFISPRIYKLWPDALPNPEGRTLDFYFESPFIKTDTSVYTLPKAFGMETLPKYKKLESEFVDFYYNYLFDEINKTVTTTAKFILKGYKIPANKFNEVKNFFDKVMEEYSEKIVIKRL